jgi:ribosome-associated toxin RatA of RatAB toxin-antitoxin module
MRIFKYLILLLLLCFAALSVFFATTESSYFVTKSKIITQPKAQLFSYVEDYNNWPKSVLLTQQSNEFKNKFTKIKTGINSGYSWKSENKTGFVKTIYSRKNDSIAQKINSNGLYSESFWSFKSTKNGTKVSWSKKGKLSFIEKYYKLFNFGVQKKSEIILESGLKNINNHFTIKKVFKTAITVSDTISKTIKKDIEVVIPKDTFNISIQGIVKRDTVFYIQKPAISKQEEIKNKIGSYLPILNKFLKDTKTETNGNPFVIYHSRDTVNNIFKYSICIPTKKKIYPSPDYNVLNGQTNPFRAVKATLVGNYNHKIQAEKQMNNFVKSSKLNPNNLQKYVEIIQVNLSTDKIENNWVTEIYLPISIPKKIILPKVLTIPVAREPVKSVLENTNMMDTIKIRK